MDTGQKLGDLTVDWLTRFLRQQAELYPVQFASTFAADTLEAVETLIVKKNVKFSSFGDWRWIGSQGQPAFANSWVNYGAPYSSAAFIKDPLGVVRLHGVIKSGTVGSAAFTLPPGYRPDAALTLPTISNGAFGRVDIFTAGTVVPTAPSSNLSVSLDGITFLAV